METASELFWVEAEGGAARRGHPGRAWLRRTTYPRQRARTHMPCPERPASPWPQCFLSDDSHQGRRLECGPGVRQRVQSDFPSRMSHRKELSLDVTGYSLWEWGLVLLGRQEVGALGFLWGLDNISAGLCVLSWDRTRLDSTEFLPSIEPSCLDGWGALD